MEMEKALNSLLALALAGVLCYAGYFIAINQPLGAMRGIDSIAFHGQLWVIDKIGFTATGLLLIICGSAAGLYGIWRMVNPSGDS
ncbi:hypothetical protein RA27_18255 [Ruegeria sp. ANG-R]|uniref:hypothetical protein n=1 Tax=Ruegeria sp. ANG-R TaxID=1577903 RepID=UPI00057F15B1|nr:hypothetical protein [Ruegeria sp. ANG-R]KIC38836.1 hypothetical protein RA27_18255 [Ruegeria sp. ANG-R]